MFQKHDSRILYVIFKFQCMYFLNRVLSKSWKKIHIQWRTLLYLGFTTKIWRRGLPIFVTSLWTPKILVSYEKEKVWTLFPMSSSNHLFGQNIFSFRSVGLHVHVSVHSNPMFPPNNDAMKKNDNHILGTDIMEWYDL